MIRILIVDDEKIERNGIKFLLKQLHMEAQIREAVNGVKALEALEEEPADIFCLQILKCLLWTVLRWQRTWWRSIRRRRW